MQTIKINSIKLGDRQRKLINKGPVQELAQSIQEKGLFHAIVCVEVLDEIQLVAGERRLRAIKYLDEQCTAFLHDGQLVPAGEIPYVLLDDNLDEIQIREAELEENLIRVDLQWQEKVAALDELHTLRLARNPQQSIQDTARELEKPTGKSFDHNRRLVTQSRLISAHLDDPDVANAKDITAAFGVVSRKLERELSIELDKRGEHYVTRHKLIHGEFHEVADTLPNDFTLIIGDPPYGMGADNFGDAANLSHNYQDDAVSALQIAEQIFERGYAITKAEAHLYMFCDIEHFLTLRAMAAKHGWKPWRTPVMWKKTTAAAHAPAGNKGFRRKYECMLFASKGGKPFAQVWDDVLEHPAPHKKDVAAQKPVELFTVLIGRSCFPGDKVLDPTCGSGTIFKAAEARRVEAYGVEKDKGAYDIAQQALNSLSSNESKKGIDPDEW